MTRSRWSSATGPRISTATCRIRTRAPATRSASARPSTCPFHDRNQGNIAHSQIAVRQAVEAEAAARFAAVTDVVNAYAALETNQKIVNLYESGYLDQARQSLEITTYVYQHGAGTLLDLLDAERTYRSTELAYRDALAAAMTSLKQINFAVGKQVIP